MADPIRRRESNDKSWRPRWWVAVTAIMSFVSGIGGFWYLVLTHDGSVNLMIGALGLIGASTSTLALEMIGRRGDSDS